MILKKIIAGGNNSHSNHKTEKMIVQAHPSMYHRQKLGITVTAIMNQL